MAETFVALADTLVADFDVVELLQGLTDRCVSLLEVDAAGLLLADPSHRLQLIASTSDAARLLELFQLQAREGPCVDCHRYGHPVVVPDIAVVAGRWPRFAPACRRAGFVGVHAVPMRYREQTIGALNLFRSDPGGLDRSGARIARALADVATIGLLQQRAISDMAELIEHLQTALDSRVVIEQAKGALAERLGLDTDEAFATLRRHARDHNLRLTELARAVVDGAIVLPPPDDPGAAITG